MKKNPTLTVLVAVFFISLSVALTDKWKNRNA